jgi:hypothetical protein
MVIGLSYQQDVIGVLPLYRSSVELWYTRCDAEGARYQSILEVPKYSRGTIVLARYQSTREVPKYSRGS